MLDKNPENWTLLNYLLVMGIAALGAIVRWKESTKLFLNPTPTEILIQFLILLSKICLAGILGWLGAYIAIEAFNQPPSMAMAISGIAGYLGSDLFKIFQTVTLEVINSIYKRGKNDSSRN